MSPLTPAPEDILVYKTPAFRPQFFNGAIEAMTFEPADDCEGQFVRLTFESGGSILIYTEDPLIWTEPERH